jgi:hypothetical protein
MPIIMHISTPNDLQLRRAGQSGLEKRAAIPGAGLRARQTVQDPPHPWQKALPVLAPGRTHQAMGGVLAGMGTPAAPPKPRGKSSSWPSERIRSQRTRYPGIKKTVAKAKKTSVPY